MNQTTTNTYGASSLEAPFYFAGKCFLQENVI